MAQGNILLIVIITTFPIVLYGKVTEIADPLKFCDYTSSWSCSRVIYFVSNTTFFAQSVPCFNKKEENIVQDHPPGFCSKLMYVTNSTRVISSVQCFELEKRQLINEDKYQQTRVSHNGNLQLVRFCSKVYFINGSEIRASSVPCSQITKLESDEVHENDRENYDFGTVFLSASLISCAGVFVMTNVYLSMPKAYKVCAESRNWSEAEDERRKLLKKALRYQSELQERRRKRREALVAENEKQSQEKLLRMISSLTRPLLDETRKFNEWMQTPD